MAFLLAALAGCSNGPALQAGPQIEDFCFDGDGDGYGTGCELGDDCNDNDSEVHENCAACASPEEGCECEIGTPPVECVGSAEKVENSYLCTGGVRYCRDGTWSECTQLVSYQTTVVKALQHVGNRKQGGVRKQAMDAGADAGGDTIVVDCGVCAPSCFLTDNPLNSGLAGSDSGLVFTDGGGLTITEWSPTDAAVVDGCAVDDSDCDGIPDSLDTWEGGAPIESDYDTIYFQLDPGEFGSASLSIDFQLRRADVYFLMDNTSSMGGELSNLKSQLTSGSYLSANPETDACNSGGVLGNLSCLMPGTQFGAGYYGDMPFAQTGSTSILSFTSGLYGRGQNQVDSVPFYNLIDSTASFGDVQAAVNTVTTANDGVELPEGAMFALNALATGDQVYAGWDRMGVHPRPAASCPDGTYGAGCLREDSLPIVVNLSDAAFSNGPYLEGWSGIISWLLSLFDGGGGLNDTFCYTQTELQPNCSGLFGFLGCLVGALLSLVQTFLGSLLCLIGGTSLLSLIDPNTNAYQPRFPIDIPASKAAVATQGTTAEYIPAFPYTNEDVDTALDLGSLRTSNGTLVGTMDGKLLTFTGDTRGMSKDVDLGPLGCGTLGDGNDATFSFSLTSPQTVTISAQGTPFDATLALLEGTSIVQTTENGTANDIPLDAYQINGGVLPLQFNRVLSGSTSGFSADVPWSSFGTSCETGGSTTAPDALYKFTPSASGPVTISGGGTTAPMAVALFDSEPLVPITQALPNDATMDVIGTFPPADISAHDYTYTNGDNTVAAIDSDYAPDVFEANGCFVGAGGKDAVIDFTVSQAGTQVEIVSGSADLTGAADFDHAIALVKHGGSSLPASPTVISSGGGTTYQTAVGLDSQATLTNRWYRYAGNLSGSNDDYDDLELGGVTPSVCDLHDNAADTVYRLNVTGTETVEISATANSFTPVVSLHKDFIGCVAASGNTNISLGGVENDVHDTRATAMDLGELDFASLTSVAGTTHRGALNGDYTRRQQTGTVWGIPQYADRAMDCMSSDSLSQARDVVYEFTLNSAHNLTFSLSSSASDTRSIALFDNLTSNSNYNRLNCSTGTGTRSFSRNLGAGTYYLVVKAGTGAGDGAPYQLNITNTNPDTFALCPNLLNGTTIDATPGSDHDTVPEALALGDLHAVELLTLSGESSSGSFGLPMPSCGAGGVTNYYTFTVNTDTTLEFSTAGSNNSNMNMTLALSTDPNNLATEIDCVSAGGAAPANNATLTAPVSAGTTYYLAVQGANTGLGTGAYEVTVNDVFSGGVADPFQDCAEEGSSIVTTLTPGTYYVTVSATTAVTSGTYSLDVKMGDSVGNLGGDMLFCSQDSLGARRTEIDQPLAAGDYSVIIRGVDAADLGNYGVRIRDVNAPAAGSSVACHDAQLAGGSGSITYPVVAGQEYYVAVRGEEVADAGNYSVNFYNAAVGSSVAMEHCFDMAGDRVDGDPEITLALAAGSYQVVLAGQDADDAGPFQLTIGNKTAGTPLAWNAPTYYGAGGILEALTDREMRVVNVLSGSALTLFNIFPVGRDEQAWSQALTLAADTNTVDSSNQPLMKHIAANGANAGAFIVNAVEELVNSLQMDVTLRLNYLDDPPSSSGFDFVAQATTSDACGTPVDTTGNGIADTHQNCNPGATPQFTVTFTNPAADPVPLNELSDDANGGYHMAVDIIADGRYLIGQVPVYIIPEVIPAGPTSPATGTFSQDTVASGCIATERPVWAGLEWAADIPADTQITFKMCTADDPADLDGCTMRTVATVTSDGTACATNADCTNGYCESGTCQYPRSPDGECDTDADCGVNGTCLTGPGACVWDNDNRVDPRPALIPGMQGLTNARVEMELRTNTDQSSAPTLYDYELSYTCAPYE